VPSVSSLDGSRQIKIYKFVLVNAIYCQEVVAVVAVNAVGIAYVVIQRQCLVSMAHLGSDSGVGRLNLENM
jgi:hypothetical protein